MPELCLQLVFTVFLYLRAGSIFGTSIRSITLFRGNINAGGNTIYCPWIAATANNAVCSACPAGTSCATGDTLCG